MSRNTFKEWLEGPIKNVHFVTEPEKRFMESFGTPDKPMALKEFLSFWNGLDADEQTELLLKYNGML